MPPARKTHRKNDDAARTGGITVKNSAYENGPPGSGAPPANACFYVFHAAQYSIDVRWRQHRPAMGESVSPHENAIFLSSPLHQIRQDTQQLRAHRVEQI
jgi:hypothetical protein